MSQKSSHAGAVGRSNHGKTNGTLPIRKAGNKFCGLGNMAEYKQRQYSCEKRSDRCQDLAAIGGGLGSPLLRT